LFFYCFGDGGLVVVDLVDDFVDVVDFVGGLIYGVLD